MPVFVADLFGAGVRPGALQLSLDVVSPFLNDRVHFRRRLFAAVTAFQQRLECDAARIAAIGYCIGGCGVLELARAGAPVIINYLGLPVPPDSLSCPPIPSRSLPFPLAVL